MNAENLISQEWKRMGLPCISLRIKAIERIDSEDYDLFRIKTARRTVGFAAIRGGRVVRMDVLGRSDLFPVLLRVVASHGTP